MGHIRGRKVLPQLQTGKDCFHQRVLKTSFSSTLVKIVFARDFCGREIKFFPGNADSAEAGPSGIYTSVPRLASLNLASPARPDAG